MLQAVERILKIYGPLISYLLSLDRGTAILSTLFDDHLTKLWLTLADTKLILSNRTIRQIESEHYRAVNSGEKFKSLEIVLRGRLPDDFIPESVSVLLFDLSEEGYTTKKEFLKLCCLFHSTATAYLNDWSKHVDNLSAMQRFHQNNLPKRLEFSLVRLLFQKICPYFLSTWFAYLMKLRI